MAKPTRELVDGLRKAAKKIESGADYSWGFVAECNCGHLAQCITSLSATEIYQKARAHDLEEWTEYANDYCPNSGVPMNSIIDALLKVGVDISDIKHLEYLSDKSILQALPGGFRYLRKGLRADAAIYMRTWASLLECRLKDLQKSTQVRTHIEPKDHEEPMIQCHGTL
ncbi:MAG: hypothetical protein AAGA18_12420 [Verrucomicrobiota bacterium]